MAQQVFVSKTVGEVITIATTSDNSTDEKDSLDQSIDVNIVLTIVYAAIFLIGVIGNVCNCLVIADSRNKYMKTATNYYLFSLSVSDLLLLIFGLPHDIVNLWHPSPYMFNQFVCISRGWISEASTYASVLVIVAFTVERYLAICHPLKAHTLSRLSRSVKIILLIWAVASSCALVVVMQYGVINISERRPDGQEVSTAQCTTVHKNELIFELSSLIFFTIPMAVITILYLKLGYHLRKKTRLAKQGEARKRKQLLGFHQRQQQQQTNTDPPKSPTELSQVTIQESASHLASNQNLSHLTHIANSSGRNYHKPTSNFLCINLAGCLRSSSIQSAIDEATVTSNESPQNEVATKHLFQVQVATSDRDCTGKVMRKKDDSKQLDATNQDEGAHVDETTAGEGSKGILDSSQQRVGDSRSTIKGYLMNRDEEKDSSFMDVPGSESVVGIRSLNLSNSGQSNRSENDLSGTNMETSSRDKESLFHLSGVNDFARGYRSSQSKEGRNSFLADNCGRQLGASSSLESLAAAAPSSRRIELLVEGCYSSEVIINCKKKQAQKERANVLRLIAKDEVANGLVTAAIVPTSSSRLFGRHMKSMATRSTPSANSFRQAASAQPITLNSTRNTANIKSVIKMLVSVVVLFFVCWAPFHAQRLMAVYVTEPTSEQVFIYSLLNHISGISYYISAIVNPILYSKISKGFPRYIWLNEDLFASNKVIPIDLDL